MPRKQNVFDKNFRHNLKQIVDRNYLVIEDKVIFMHFQTCLSSRHALFALCVYLVPQDSTLILSGYGLSFIQFLLGIFLYVLLYTEKFKLFNCLLELDSYFLFSLLSFWRQSLYVVQARFTKIIFYNQQKFSYSSYLTLQPACLFKDFFYLFLQIKSCLECHRWFLTAFLQNAKAVRVDRVINCLNVVCILRQA